MNSLQHLSGSGRMSVSASKPQSIFDVGQHCPRQQPRTLKYEGDPTPHVDENAPVVRAVTSEPNGPGRLDVECREQPEQRTLPGPGRADETKYLTGGDLKPGDVEDRSASMRLGDGIQDVGILHGHVTGLP